MTHVFYRQIHADLPQAVKGEGIYIIDAGGCGNGLFPAEAHRKARECITISS